MREIVLDTETTGFDPEEGHRIVEIGAVELFNSMPTGRTYHQYINPQRDVPTGAFEVHGLSEEFLRPYPVFALVADAFLEFVDGARLIIHNASFDMRFLNFELRQCKRPLLPENAVLDTLALARKKFPGSPASLDALCRRFGVDNSAREKHGALLDSEILAEVYLELIGGRQPDLVLSSAPTRTGPGPGGRWVAPRRASPLPPRITESEEGAHRAFVEKLGEGAIWRRFSG